MNTDKAPKKFISFKLMLAAAASSAVPTKLKTFFIKTFFVRWQIFFLSELLFRANKEYVAGDFYVIKKKLLAKFGKHIDYDVQFIEGKECWSCDGTGIYKKYYHNQWHRESCYCGNGWHKDPVWNILARVQFGKYIFHQPYQRAYSKPEITKPIIDGYINHTRVKYGGTCLFILMLMYEKGYWKKYYRNYNGWRIYWYYPRNWGHTILHIVKYGRKSVPARRLYDKIYFTIQRLKAKVKPEQFTEIQNSNDDLPF